MAKVKPADIDHTIKYCTLVDSHISIPKESPDALQGTSASTRRLKKSKRKHYEDVIPKLLEDLVFAVKDNTAVLRQVKDTYLSHLDERNADIECDDNVSIKRTDKVTAEVMVTYLKIIDVDTVKQQYVAEIMIQTTWAEPRFQDLNVKDFSKIKMKGIWKPEITVTNCTSITGKDSNHCFITRRRNSAYPVVCHQRTFTGTFSERLELQNFPFDLQELGLELVSKQPSDTVQLIIDRHELSSVKIDSAMDQDEWIFYEHVEISSKLKTPSEDKQGESYSSLQFNCSVKRTPGYYLWNVIFVMFLLTSLRFTAYAEDVTKIQQRLVLGFTTLLTCVAFKTVIHQSLPQISYLTQMDFYVLGSMGFVAVQCVQMALMAIYKNDTDYMALADSISLYVLIGAHILFNVVFVIMWLVKHNSGLTQLSRKEDQYKRRKWNLNATTGEEHHGRVNPGFKQPRKNEYPI